MIKYKLQVCLRNGDIFSTELVEEPHKAKKLADRYIDCDDGCLKVMRNGACIYRFYSKDVLWVKCSEEEKLWGTCTVLTIHSKYNKSFVLRDSEVPSDIDAKLLMQSIFSFEYLGGNGYFAIRSRDICWVSIEPTLVTERNVKEWDL